MTGKIWKLSGLMAVLLVLVMLAGCGDTGSSAASAGSSAASGAAAASSAVSSAGGSAAGTEEASAGSAEAAAAADGPFVFTYEGTEIRIDAEAAPVLEKLGEPDSYFEAASCAFDGLDKMYTYASFELDTYPMEDADYVSSITFRDDLVSTDEGIAIGASRADVEAAYGTPEEDGASLVYERGDMRLTFILEEDSVTSIQYQTKALD